MKWGVRKDERPLSIRDQALNVSQRSQVRVASAVSAIAAVGMASNAAATLFQMQARFERLQIIKTISEEAANSPFIEEAAKESLKTTRSHVIKGLVGSAIATTAVSMAVGIVSQRVAKAYFAPLHKVYGDSKSKINSDLKTLSKDIAKGKRSSMSDTQYYKEVSSIVQKHMTRDHKNFLKPFHELGRSQLGLEYNTKQLKVNFEKLPNTDLYSKMTVTTPNGLKMVKAVKEVKHSDEEDEVGSFDFYFDYSFDSKGFVSEFSCPTIEILDDILSGTLDVESLEDRYDRGSDMSHTDQLVSGFLTHYGVKKPLTNPSQTLIHKEETLQDVLDDMSPEQKDLFELLVGAALEDEDISMDNDVVAGYDAFPEKYKHLLDFTVGNILVERGLNHSEDLENESLSHFGVKGMKWGVRRDNTSSSPKLSKITSAAARESAQVRVENGVGTLLDAHRAALKSTGHRAINAFTGDKTFWKRMAITAGVTGVGGAVLALGPFALPASITGAVGAAMSGNSIGLLSTSAGLITNAELGAVTLAGAGLVVTKAGLVGATAVNVVGNTMRAVGGNTRINRSAAKLGADLKRRQTEGSRRVNKMLRKSGSLNKNDLRHNDPYTLLKGDKAFNEVAAKYGKTKLKEI